MAQNYTIFTNGIPVRICNAAPKGIELLKDILVVRLNVIGEIAQLIPLIENPSTLAELHILTEKPSEAFASLASHFTMMSAAGGLVEHSSHILMIYKYGKWDLPKGKIEQNETHLEAAIREVHEETGIQCEGGDLLEKTYHIYSFEGDFILKENYWFRLSTNEMSNPIAQAEEGIKKAEWINSDNIDAVLKESYPAIVGLLRSNL